MFARLSPLTRAIQSVFSPHRLVVPYGARTERPEIIDSVRTLLQAARVRWSWNHLLSVAVGSAIAWKDGYFSPHLFVLMWLSLELLHAATCMINDYWDHKSGADDVVDRFTVFNAGSRVIQEGKMTPGTVLLLSMLAYAGGTLIGLYLVLVTGWELLAIGAAGVLLSYFYTAPPVKLCYRGMEQVGIGLCYGLLMIMAAYFAQTQQIALEPLLVSLPYTLTVSMMVYVKGFQDEWGDRRTGKQTLIVKIGKRRAASYFVAYYLAAYLIAALGVLSGTLPLWTLAILLTLPMALKAQAILKAAASSSDPFSFLPALGIAQRIHLLVGAVLIVAYVAEGIHTRVA